MSYGRNPLYIYSDGEYMNFVGSAVVPEYYINALLYKLLLRNRREELGRRLREGKAVWLRPSHYPSESDVFPTEMPVDHPEYAAQVGWMDLQEDDIIRALMAEAPREG